MKNAGTAAALLGAVLAAALPAAGAEDTKPEKNYGDLSIEELMNESVSSVSKKETPLSQSAAAIAVVNPEDIRRLGVTTIPEALRLVPGLDVARISANAWAVSARGFNGEFANKLLVLIDGRSIYTPASGGVFWDAQDVVFEDLERIEVIRGPGATLWGANAVNGVINLTTKNARDTQGVLVSTSLGTEDRASATVRYGGRLAPDFHYRVYAKYFDRDGLVDATGRATAEGWHALRGGFRADWVPAPGNELMFEGDIYGGRVAKRVFQVTLTPPVVQTADSISPNRGGHVLGRWTRAFSEESELTVQVYYDRVEQSDGYTTEYRDTGDFELQHRLNLGGRHDVVWGTGYRFVTVEHSSSFRIGWPARPERLRYFNVFAQDEIALVPERLYFTVGSKFEHNNLTGWAAAPSARLRWTPAGNQTVWAAVSRATRTPSRLERSVRLNNAAFQPSPTGPVFLQSLFGSPDLAEEKLIAYELGWRLAPTKRLSLDLAVFRHDYNDLISLVANPTVFEASPAPPHLLVSSNWRNALTARTYGAELSLKWQPTSFWHWVAGYTWLHMRVRPDPSLERDSPQHQFQLRMSLDLPHRWAVNSAAYYVSHVTPAAGSVRVPVPAYVRFDLGVTWLPTAAIELGIWGQNLLERRHAEYVGFTSPERTQVPRGVTGRVTWRF